jgi:DNA repair protein SbcC/Rad50
MRIKKIHIIKYGPINALELDISPGLQVIMGPNESGKTLTIDAVIKMLLEGKTRDFEHIDRVSQEPEGYILFEDSQGKEQKVDIRKGLERHMDLGGMDLRNIFIIRDSDLTLRDECGYFRNITDKLTGLRLEQIEDIMSYIQDFGRLVNPSSDSRLSNDKKFGKISQLRVLASDFSREAKEYIEVSEENKLDYLELEQLAARQKINSIRKDIKESERMLQWQEYRKNAASLRNLSDRWKVYKDHKDFSQAKYEKISELIINIDSLGGRASRILADQEKNIKQRTGLEEKLAQVQGKLDVLESKKTHIDRLKADLEIYNRRKAEEVKEPESFSRVITVILLLLAPISFPAVYIPTRSILYSFIMPLLLLIAGLVIFIVNRAGIKSDRFAAEGILLENEFKKIGFRIESLADVLPAAAVFDDAYREKAGERERLDDQVRLLEMDDKKLSAALEDDIRDKKSYELELEEIMGSLGIRDLNQFNEKRRLRNRAASEVMSLARSLREMPGGDIPGYDPDRDLGEMAERFGDTISIWEDKLSRLKPEGDSLPEDKEAGKEKLEDLRSELEALEEKESSLKKSLEEHKNRLNSFQGKFAGLVLSRHLDKLGPFDITNLERLREAVDHCNRFVGLIDRQQYLAAEAIRIFEDIKNTEETKVSELFEKLKISDIFADITGGKYKDVRFDSQAGEVTVVDTGGNILTAKNLSKGAYDQLFLSIRIAISEEILGEGRGFFIIDDAFLSSDSRRLENQFKVLKKLADKGWSIVYFSVKDEISSLSKKYTVNKAIEMK